METILKSLCPPKSQIPQSARKYLVFVAKLANKAKRYGDVVNAMRKLVNLGVKLTKKERDLLDIGFRGLVEARVTSWKIIDSIEKEEVSIGSRITVDWVKEYKRKIELEISRMCFDIIHILDEDLIPNAAAGKSSKFYNEMKKGFYGYMAEVKTGQEIVGDEADKLPQRSSLFSQSEREYLIVVAWFAKEAERFEETVKAIMKVVNLGMELTMVELQLLSLGFRGLIITCVTSCHCLDDTEKSEYFRRNKIRMNWFKEYRHKIELELSRLCFNTIDIVDKNLIPNAAAGESLVSYYRMKGDYYRYMAEVKTGEERKALADESFKAYKTAYSTAETDLSPANPSRLDLILKFSVLYYDIMDSPERACDLAKQAFDEAISELDSLSEQSYKKIGSYMQQLKINLTSWTSNIPEESSCFMQELKKSLARWPRKISDNEAEEEEEEEEENEAE